MPTDLDAKVATLVMGWTQCRSARFTPLWAYPESKMSEDGVYRCGPFRPVSEFRPSINPVHDYEVLVFVRENWDPGHVSEFGHYLDLILEARCPAHGWVHAYYHPGDYSTAALAVVEERE